VRIEYLLLAVGVAAFGLWAMAAADCADRGGTLVRAPLFGVVCVEAVK
jgi:hypothetical protein